MKWVCYRYLIEQVDLNKKKFLFCETIEKLKKILYLFIVKKKFQQKLKYFVSNNKTM